ncbi:helix-turn-helix domain-containing protein [Caldinitratiruptor microaerophilus]|uniref:Helix-turn-helix domain-containing protein n=1 Tax=Caldinitratiruptor microaerophilus TaxID=671077 RepID=A0AA35CLI4_9FIRM|nr:helix-turn-helix domain-containing protein [Caldinitratiruptor microaerophilus]BDG61529.1 hypothetical protein caldi_26190 [Caldinitratiruptor microaerophilus]
MELQAQAPGRFLRRRKAAEYCGVSLRTFDGWLAAGLPHLKIGNIILIDRDELERWLSAHRRGGYTASA